MHYHTFSPSRKKYEILKKNRKSGISEQAKIISSLEIP